MKILLMGNPNVGKSCFFSRLTGVHVISSNYPNTTVEFTKGVMHLGQEQGEIIDAPGTYTLQPTSKAEEVALAMLVDVDVVINIVDSTNLERSLNLTLQLLKKKIPLIIALNLWDEARHTGIKIDLQKLQKILGVDCIPTCAITGEGFKELVSKIAFAKQGEYEYEEEERWHEVGNIVSQVERITHKHHTFSERLADASIHPITGIPIAFITLYATFSLTRFIGEGLMKYLTEPFFERLWAPLMLKLSSLLGEGGILHHILIGNLLDGKIDFNESFGLLTTGLFIEFSAILPYIISFYLVISILEDSGYLPRLAIVVDNIMHRLGLHGMAIIPMMLGFGCNIPGVLATRMMETKRERFIALTLMAISVPCMAKSAMIIGLLGRYGPEGLGVVFGTLFFSAIALGLALNRFVKGESMEMFLEIPPYRFPYPLAVAKKLWIKVTWFFKDAFLLVLLGVAIANILWTLGIIEFIGSLFAPVISGVFGLPKEAVAALLVGLLRKDVALGMLAPLHLTLNQLITASVVLSMYFPCLATFSIIMKELGLKDMLKIVGVMAISTLLVGGILNLFL